MFEKIKTRRSVVVDGVTRREERVTRRQERVAKRRDFRIKVSGNRKWIMLGLAVVAVCVTLIFLVIKFSVVIP